MRSASAATAQKYCPSCRDRFSGEALFCPNDGSPLLAVPADESSEKSSAAPQPVDTYLGREISGHIEIRQLAGVGAMGRVYRAFQKGIDRDVAVKILHRELSANPQLVARFHREAKVASRLQHPNVVHVHLAGQLPDGALYIVMEYLDGMSLQSAMVATGGAMPLPRALHIALQLCDAVGEAHAQGVVHRDLKPENVMLVRRGEDVDYVKVLDFGIARLSWGEQSMATAAGLIFGTARYISPEGAQGESVGPPGDVYAIATLLYQMLAGRTPFEGEQAVGILIQQIHDAPSPLKSHPLAASVPDPLADVIMQNLAKDRNARAPDARAFGRALLDVMRVSGSSPRISGASFPSVPSLDVPMLPGAATTRWTPPVAIQAQLALAAENFLREKEPTPAPLAATIDDPESAQPVRVPAVTPSAPATLASTVRIPPPPSFPPAEPWRGSSPSTIESPSAPPSKPRSSVEVTLNDADGSRPPASEASRPQRRLVRFFALFFILFLVGSGAAALAAYHLGYLSPRAGATNLDDILVRARMALADGRWDSPPGDNVLDLTTEGLVLWPGEPRLLDIRARASEELMKLAIAAKASGDVQQAVRDARLATRFDPSDASKRALVHEYESDIAQGTGTDPLLHLADAGSGSPIAKGPRAFLETSPPKPRIGQQVDFAAKVGGDNGKNVTDARFVVAGNGLGTGARLTAVVDGGVYRAGFTFLEAGRFEVTFSAKIDGSTVRGARLVIVEGAKTEAPTAKGAPPAASSEASAPPAASTTGPAPSAAPAPSGSAKWL
ncbi:protein kinase domain-containing protein [Pendulispora albinea]|uniref:Protein kinase n=1 Tax=Pendulispora albinea TaxID=2741071 RepID=A0ABZ2M0A4_9BACT